MNYRVKGIGAISSSRADPESLSRWDRRNWAALIAAIAAGLSALGFVVIARWSLGLVGFEPVAHVWSFWSLSAAVVTFSSTKVAVLGEMGTRAIPRRSLLPAAGLSAFILLFSYVNRQELFNDTGLVWPALCAVMPLGSFIVGWARGATAGRNATAQLAIVVAGESALRAAVALVLALIGAPPLAFGLSILSGYLVAFVPIATSGRAARGLWALPNAGRVALAGSVSGLSAHSILVLGPALMAVHGAEAATISSLFIILAVYRAPYQLAMAMSPRLMYLFGSVRGRRRFIRGSEFLVLFGGAMLIAGTLAWGLGDSVIGSIFGTGGELAPIDHALAVVLAILVTFGVLSTLVLLGGEADAALTMIWAVPTGVSLVILYWWPFAPTNALAVLISAAVVVVLGQLWLMRRKSHRSVHLTV